MPARYTLGCHLTYEVRSPTVFVFNIEVARLNRHTDLTERLNIGTEAAVTVFTDPNLGNRYIRVGAAPGTLIVSYEAEVALEPHRAIPLTVQETPVTQLPPHTLPYLLPSRFVACDELTDFARKQFGHLSPGFSRITAICNWIYDNIDYRRGASNEFTTATETLIHRAGVCRDFAHLGIAFCRALEIPARFTSCYALGLDPDDFHAVFEVWLDGRWWLFDATRQAHLDGMIRIGVGRDAADTAFSTSFVGEVDCGDVNVFMRRLDDTTDDAPRTTEAISTEDSVMDETLTLSD